MMEYIYFLLEVKFKILKLSNWDDWKICIKKEAKRKREKNEIFPQKEKRKENSTIYPKNKKSLYTRAVKRLVFY